MATAFARPQVSLRLSAFLLQVNGTHSSAVPLGDRPVQAGDRVRFVIEASNKGTSPALNLTPMDPIPAHMTYVPGSAKDGSAAVQFTIDGKTWSARPMVSLRSAKGVVRKPADPSLYKAIRWVTRKPLAANSTFTYSFEARVNGHRAGAK
jgi:uncharacterized repeat protein (TIGR01451 family)